MNELILSPWMMLILGVLAHFAKAMIQARKGGDNFTPVQYWRHNPYQSVLTVIGAIAGYAALSQMTELNAINAFGVGFMANSMADIIGGRVSGKF